MTDRPEAYRYHVFLVRRDEGIWRAYTPLGERVRVEGKSEFSSAEEAEAAVDHFRATEEY